MNLDDHYRIKKLETRVEALEKRGHEASIIRDGRWGAQADNAYERYPEIVDTTQGRCIVPEERVLRWERIERAAKQAKDWTQYFEPNTSAGAAHDVLTEALKPCE